MQETTVRLGKLVSISNDVFFFFWGICVYGTGLVDDQQGSCIPHANIDTLVIW